MAPFTILCGWAVAQRFRYCSVLGSLVLLWGRLSRLWHCCLGSLGFLGTWYRGIWSSSSDLPSRSSSLAMSYETSILSSFSNALLVPGALSSPSDIIMFSDIFCEWSGKTAVSILILWISSVADWIEKLIEMCSRYQSRKECFLTILYSFEGSKILCFYWLFMFGPIVCLHRRSLRAQHELCFLCRLKCKILSRYCDSFARREFPALV